MSAKITFTPVDDEKGPFDPGAMIASGEWSLSDLPWLPAVLFDGFLRIFEEENYRCLAMTTRGNEKRGQFLLHNRARENLRLKRDELEAMSQAHFHPEPTP